MKTTTVTTIDRSIQGIDKRYYGVRINGKEVSLITHPSKNPLLNKLTVQQLAEHEANRILNS